jgi:hypothetical protein
MKTNQMNIDQRFYSGRSNPRTFPLSHRNFQASGCADLGHCAAGFSGKRPSFRRISGDYFAREARQHFALEAGLFALIVVTAALPLLNSATALFDFLKATGTV